jgi:hypothetical protein
MLSNAMTEVIADLKEAAKGVEQKNLEYYDSYAMEVVKLYAASANANPTAIPHLYHNTIIMRKAFLAGFPNSGR